MGRVNTGEVWGLHRDGALVARVVVTGAEFPWVHGQVEALPGFEAIRPLFAEQEAADEAEDFEAAEQVYLRIRAETSMTKPGGEPVAEYWLKIFDDDTCGWRWSDEPFED